MVRLFITFLIATLIIFLCSGAEGSAKYYPATTRPNKPVQRLFIFGDSYADTGNTPKGLTNCWKVPYGETFPGQPSGRFSDGRVLTDFIAKYFGFTSPIAYSTRKLFSHKARHGVNFAFGGTGALNTLATMEAGFPNMTTQIDFFEKMLKGNDIVSINTDLSDAAAFVSLVGNDYNTYLSSGGSSGPKFNKKDLQNFIQKVVQQLIVDVARIRTLGIKRIYVTALQPLGCLPQITANSSFTKCNDEINIAVQLHNFILHHMIEQLNIQFDGSNPSIFIIDLFTAFNTVFQEKHGCPSGSLRFPDPLKPCCFPTLPNGSCSDVDDKGNKLYTLCDNPAKTFFWDTYHPTEAGWRAVFTQLKNALHTF